MTTASSPPKLHNTFTHMYSLATTYKIDTAVKPKHVLLIVESKVWSLPGGTSKISAVLAHS